MKDLKDMQPLNSNEDYLYGLNARMEILIDSVNKLSKVVENSIKPVEVKKEEIIEIDESEVDYNTFTKAELQEILTYKEIEYNSRMTKAELIELLN